jgi:hypothetical protein
MRMPDVQEADTGINYSKRWQNNLVEQRGLQVLRSDNCAISVEVVC